LPRLRNSRALFKPLAEHRFAIINMLAHRSVGAKAPRIFQGINGGNDGRKRR
jgi:hypothetical protein